MSVEFLALVAFDGWCGTKPPGRHPPIWPPHGPTTTVQSAITSDSGTSPVPWFHRFINNTYYATLAGLLVITAVTHPEQAFSLRYGPFMLVPTINIVAGLYYTNMSAPATMKVKM